MVAYRRVDDLRSPAGCLYTGISSGPNARYRVWEAFTFLPLGFVLGFELVFRLGLGLGLVVAVQFMTVHILTVQIKTGNYGTVSSAHFLAHVYCRQIAGWINMPFGMEVRLGPDHIVLDGNPAPHKGHSSPLNFGWCPLWPSGWMDQNATWYGGRPERRRHCVR